MKVVIAGASGLIGGALVPALRAAGDEVLRLVRRRARTADEIEWDPAHGRIDATQIEGVEAVVNLAGENVGGGRWTSQRRERILRSRIDTTRTLVTAMSKLEDGRSPRVLVNASAIGIYGDRGDEIVTEASEVGRGFLPEVCRAWEAEAEGASRLGVRTVLLRFAVVMARDGGALAKMLPVFRLGLGGRLGSGKQWLSWVAIDDVVGAIQRALADAHWTGALNIVSPQPVTNADFTRVLSRVLRRPAVLPVPAWVLRVVFGEMANETLLMSTRAVPSRLVEMGFRFRHTTLEDALREVLR